MGKNYKKNIEQFGVRKGSPMKGWGLWREGFYKEKVSLSLEWNRVGVIDNDSGDDGTDELREFN